MKVRKKNFYVMLTKINNLTFNNIIILRYIYYIPI